MLFVDEAGGGLMSSIEYYRELMSRDLTLARAATLPAVRMRHERSAEVWQELAERTAATEAQRAINVATKRQHA
jgi:hypothetical protein